MINKIIIKNVKCYKDSAVLETDKKINLIYGLNGTGKSTISDFFLKNEEEKYKSCSLEGLTDNDEILVYNQTFIQENFFENKLNGIFTLSKRNKDAEIKIEKARGEIKEYQEIIGETEVKITKERKEFEKTEKNAKENVWKIKKDYSGGDRVLEYCLEGFKNDSKKLLEFLEKNPKGEKNHDRNIDDIKAEAILFKEENLERIDFLQNIDNSFYKIEKDPIFTKVIVGEENSTISELIIKLGNSDWVKQGLEYISEKKENQQCPFCQSESITPELYKKIKDYFGKSYEQDITLLEKYKLDYINMLEKILDIESIKNITFSKLTDDLTDLHSNLISLLKKNIEEIDKKLKTPSTVIFLEDSFKLIEIINFFINDINKEIEAFNLKIEKKEETLKEIKEVFWSIMRFEFDQTIEFYIKEKKSFYKNINELEKKKNESKHEIKNRNDFITEESKKTINIEKEIQNINNNLSELGIEDFKIEHESDNFYKIVRDENEEKIFQSLSEGEKMIISFLYFIELCRGNKKPSEIHKNKIVVIDDPISSLSHIFIFNIGRLIKNELFENDNIKQIFLLTHSLYFFYEMTEIKKDKREEKQKLFRIQKNRQGSQIVNMRYEEIQNDYHSYWTIIKDQNSPPALIANCMRNIIEYFFGFVEKKNINETFQKQELRGIRFQAFNRYINRESHSIGQNIFDLKEYNYEDFKDGFKLVFTLNNYGEHYNKMIR